MTATLLIAVLPLVGLVLCFWALLREPAHFIGAIGLFFLMMVALNWIG